MYRKLIFGSVAVSATLLSLLVPGPAYAASAGLPLGPSTSANELTYKGYYDGHIDTFVVTDVSNKAQAKAMHINYSAELSSIKGLPAQYFIEGPAAAKQISVFGSEPGESDYNPLWEEVVVAGALAPSPFC